VRGRDEEFRKQMIHFCAFRSRQRSVFLHDRKTRTECNSSLFSRCNSGSTLPCVTVPVTGRLSSCFRTNRRTHVVVVVRRPCTTRGGSRTLVWKGHRQGVRGTEVFQRGPGAEPRWGFGGEAPAPRSPKHVTS